MNVLYDLAVIGGGPGGYSAAEFAAARGLSTILFEKDELGGVCLNEGCIPTKTLLYSAKISDSVRHGAKYGVEAGEPSVNFQDVMKRKKKVVRKLVGGVKLRMKNAGVEVVQGEAVILGKEDGRVRISAAGQNYEAKNLLICTGATAAVPPVPGLKEAGERVVTSREMLSLETPPQSLVIIGGGVIGMEFASFYNSIGTKVTVVEMLPKILGPIDAEISETLLHIYEKKGVEFHLGCKVCAIDADSVVCENPEGETFRVSGEKILLSVGRRARLQSYGLESLGVAVGRGIKVDDRMRTNVPGVYAAGDVTGFCQLAHCASREAEVAVNVICGGDDRMDYGAVPSVVYTNPEVASVGMTEKGAETASLSFASVKLPMQYSGRFVAENEMGEGFIKLLYDTDSGKVLGVQMIGNPCSEIIYGMALAIQTGTTLDTLRKTIFPHPSVSEIIKEALHTAETRHQAPQNTNLHTKA